MEFMEVIRQRYSVRKFGPEPVGRDTINILLEAARLAPTAVNRQPQRLLVLQSPDDMAKLANCTKYTFNAPAAIVVCAAMDQAWVRPYDQENSAVIDAGIVGTYLMLTICDLGLGACWVGHFDPEAVKREFGLPEHVRPVAIFPFGYPAKDSEPSSRHSQRLPLADTVRYHSFRNISAEK